jgi:hypothetical protein
MDSGSLCSSGLHSGHSQSRITFQKIIAVLLDRNKDKKVLHFFSNLTEA